MDYSAQQPSFKEPNFKEIESNSAQDAKKRLLFAAVLEFADCHGKHFRMTRRQLLDKYPWILSTSSAKQRRFLREAEHSLLYHANTKHSREPACITQLPTPHRSENAFYLTHENALNILRVAPEYMEPLSKLIRFTFSKITLRKSRTKYLQQLQEVTSSVTTEIPPIKMKVPNNKLTRKIIATYYLMDYYMTCSDDPTLSAVLQHLTDNIEAQFGIPSGSDKFRNCLYEMRIPNTTDKHDNSILCIPNTDESRVKVKKLFRRVLNYMTIDDSKEFNEVVQQQRENFNKFRKRTNRTARALRENKRLKLQELLKVLGVDQHRRKEITADVSRRKFELLNTELLKKICCM